MENIDLDFWALIQQGAISTYPLLLCSVLVLGITLERLWSLRGILSSTTELSRNVVSHLTRGAWQDAVKAIQQHAPCPARRILADLLDAGRETPIEQLERIADERQFEEVQGAGTYLWILGTIGAAAPFIGLFGTVIGIIRAFHAMALAGTGGFAVVAAGISEALIATALGLAVGITALVLYNYFQARVEQIQTVLRVGSARVLEAVVATGSDDGV